MWNKEMIEKYEKNKDWFIYEDGEVIGIKENAPREAKEVYEYMDPVEISENGEILFIDK